MSDDPEQPDLFGTPPPAAPLPEMPPFTGLTPETLDTSRAAAKAIAIDAATLRFSVLVAIDEAACGLTDEEVQDLLGMNGSTERPRRIELWDLKLVQQIGVRRTRSGREAAVWATTAAGEALVKRGGGRVPRR